MYKYEFRSGLVLNIFNSNKNSFQINAKYFSFAGIKILRKKINSILFIRLNL